MSYRQALGDEAIKVMDKAAMGLAMEHRLPIVVFDAMQDGSILKVAQGQSTGTTIG
jgi:uridylate kinase